MGVVDYVEATEYCLKHFGICRGCNFRRVVALFLLICYSLNIVFWIFMSGNAWTIATNVLLFISAVIGSVGIAIFNYVALAIFTLCTTLSAIASIISVILVSTDIVDPDTAGSSLPKTEFIILLSSFAFVQAIFFILLLNILKNIKIYATSGSVYMNFMNDDFDF